MVLLRSSINQKNENDDYRNVRNSYGGATSTANTNEINTVHYMPSSISRAVNTIFGVQSAEIGDNSTDTSSDNNNTDSNKNDDGDGDEDDDGQRSASYKLNNPNSIKPKPINQQNNHFTTINKCDDDHRISSHIANSTPKWNRGCHKSTSLTQLFSLRRHWCSIMMHFNRMHLAWIILWYLMIFGIQSTAARPNAASNLYDAAPVVAATATSNNGVSTFDFIKYNCFEKIAKKTQL